MGIGSILTWVQRLFEQSSWLISRPVHAHKLVNEHKIENIEQLRSHPKVNELLNKTQQLGLKYYQELEEKIPREEMKQMEVSFDFDSDRSVHRLDF